MTSYANDALRTLGLQLRNSKKQEPENKMKRNVFIIHGAPCSGKTTHSQNTAPAERYMSMSISIAKPLTSVKLNNSNSQAFGNLIGEVIQLKIKAKQCPDCGAYLDPQEKCDCFVNCKPSEKDAKK